MYTWDNAVLTSKGKALLAKLTSGHTLSLVRAVTGTGYVGETSLKHQSSVTGEKQELWFATQSYPEEGTCAVPVRLYNTGLATGYIATQIGIYAMDPDEGEILYLIAQAGQDDGTKVPSESEMPGYSAEWTFYLEYGQADSVSVTVDPSNTVNEDRVRSIISEVVTKENLGIDRVDNTPDSEKLVKFASQALNASRVINSLVIRINGGSTEGTDMFTFNGGSAKSVNITPAKIGAAKESHTHAASDISSGAIAMENGGTAATTRAGALANLSAMGGTPQRMPMIYTYLKNAGVVSETCTTEELVLALPFDSAIAFSHTINQTPYMSDAPVNFGYCTIYKGFSNDYITAYFMGYEGSFYVYKYSTVHAKSNGWKRICQYEYGDTLPAAGIPGRVFFKKVSS